MAKRSVDGDVATLALVALAHELASQIKRDAIAPVQEGEVILAASRAAPSAE